MLGGMLSRMVARLVTSGDLEITWPDGTTGRYGDGTGESVHAKISDPGLLRRLMRNPELALGEGYMDGGLTIEGDDLTGFLRLIARNVRENGSGRFSAAAAAARTGLRRFAQSNPINIARQNVEAHYDLQSGRYVAQGFDNQDPVNTFNVEMAASQFTPQALRTRGKR